MTSGRPLGRQLPLTLPHRPAMERADFLESAANAAAVALVDRWPAWPPAGALIAGPAGSGKSHLVEIFRGLSGATVAAAAGLDMATAEAATTARAIAVEDIHAGPLDEAALFHLLNLAAERGTAVLMTSRLRAAALPLSVPDLASRLRAAQAVELSAPDDDLLRRVLTKLFADRQLAVDPAVVEFIVMRMERSLEAANAIVEHLDREALAAGRPVTRQLAASVLGEGPLVGGED
jgi:chromosomal replication initiation ATPase DnaA